MDYDDDFNIIAKQQLTYNNKHQFTIGHDIKSCTQNPGFYKSTEHDNIYFVDCPGTQDQNKFKEFPNQTCVHNIQRGSGSCLILYVIGVDAFANRGDGFIVQMTSILRQFSATLSKE